MPIRILVIEDVDQIRENIAELLGINGYDVQTAADGVKGVECARVWQPDLILSDILMPNLDGHQVLESVRNNPELAHIPFVFLTAKAEMQDLRYSMTLGADDYLTKPFRTGELLSAIESRLTRVKQHYGTTQSTTDNNYLKTVLGRDSRGTTLLQTDDCFFFFTSNREYFVHHPMGIFQVSLSLDKLTAALDPMLFFRANRNRLLHRKTVEKYTYWDKGKYCLFLVVGSQRHETTLAKARFRQFKKWFSG